MRSKRLKTQSKNVTTNGCDNTSDINSSDGQINNSLIIATNGQTNNLSDNQMTNKRKCQNNSSDQTIDPNFNYTPKLCLRCHCKQNDPFDNSTAIWSAVFQPKTDESDGYRFAATCGSNMVCIIDCLQCIERKSRAVIARYIDSDKNEEFVSLAWSVISLPSEKGDPSQSLILAVGGKTALLLLSNLNEFHCYERVGAAHSDQINALLFTQNDLLFSASYDKTIKLWRISLPNDKSSTQLLKCIDTKDNLLSLCYSNKYQVLMASGWKGVHFWINSLDLSHNSKSVLSQMKTKALVDGLQGIPEEEDLIAIRINSSKYISVIDLKKVIEETHKTNNCLKSEVKLILFSKVLKTKLKSFDFEYPFIYLSAQKNLLISGGPNGQMWLYDTKRLSQYLGSNQIGNVDRIFEWPQIENIFKDNKSVIDDKKPVVINTVAISPDLKYIIGCTSINCILIWLKT